jgi:hypothetical protein
MSLGCERVCGGRAGLGGRRSWERCPRKQLPHPPTGLFLLGALARPNSRPPINPHPATNSRPPTHHPTKPRPPPGTLPYGEQPQPSAAAPAGALAPSRQLIARSDTSGEDLEGYAGAGLYDR